MKKIHTQLYILITALAWIALTPSAFADTGLIDVVFHNNTPLENTALFKEANILPGDGITRNVTVTNTSDEPQDVYMQLVGAYQTKDLAEVLQITVSDGTNTVLNTVTLSDLFGGVQSSLTTGLAGGDAVTYEVTIAFDPNAGDAYQEGEVGFDFCIGFSGGAFGCDGDGNSREEPTDPPEEETSGGGGRVLNSSERSGESGGQGGSNLTIDNEGTENTDGQTGSTDVTWDTNKPATSRVVCGPEEDGPYRFNLDAKNFGYPWGTTETNALITKHSVSFTGLEEGTYLCRVASREDTDDDWTVSSEFSFVLSNSEEGEAASSFIGTGGTPVALAAHDSKEETNEDEEDTSDSGDPAQEKQNGQVAGALTSIDDALKNDTCNTAWWVWVIVIASFIVITTWTREMLTHIQPTEHIKRLYVFSLLGILVFLIALIADASVWILPIGVGTFAIFVAGFSDRMLTQGTDTGYVRFVRILVSLIFVLLGALLIALIFGWVCAIIPIVVSIIILAIRYALHKGAE